MHHRLTGELGILGVSEVEMARKEEKEEEGQTLF